METIQQAKKISEKVLLAMEVLVCGDAETVDELEQAYFKNRETVDKIGKRAIDIFRQRKREINEQ